MVIQMAQEMLSPGRTVLNTNGDWRVMLHTGLVLSCMICMIFAALNGAQQATAAAEREAERQARLMKAIVENIPRSEEQTSEPQYLMRTSYDVFCLKKKQ